MSAQGADLNDKFVALLEQPDFALCGKRQLHPDFVGPVSFRERVGFFRSGNRRRVLWPRIQHLRKIFEPLFSQDLVFE